MTLHQKRSDLINQRDQSAAMFNAEIADLERQIQQEAHENGRRLYPKWAAMTPEQQRHCEFMGFDPDNPDIPLD